MPKRKDTKRQKAMAKRFTKRRSHPKKKKVIRMKKVMTAKNYDEILTDLYNKQVFPGVINRAFLYGPPGTGKSTIGVTLFGRERVERVALSGKTPIEDLLGMMTLAKDGSIVWVDGPATRALREGKCLILDEMDQVSPALRCTLHALLDQPAAVTLPNGERVNAAPGYCVIGTSNESPATLAEALQDRFELILAAFAPSAGLKAQLSQKSQGILDNVTARRVEDGKEHYKWSRPITPRLLLAIESLLRAGLSLEDISAFLYREESHQTDLLSLFAEGCHA